MEEAIVLYPSPGIGHLIPMVELGKLILTHQSSLSIHILITPPPYSAGPAAPFIASVSSKFPSIIFHHLPIITLPPSITSSSRHHETLTFEVARRNNLNVHQAILSISKTFAINCLILDFFCIAALSVANELNLPAYCLFTSPAGFLAGLLYLPTLHSKTSKSFKDLNAPLDIPGVPPIPSSDMPTPTLERNDLAYQGFFEVSTKLPKVSAIIVNSFEPLEQRTVRAITDGLCVPDGPTPPVYSIGPLIAEERGHTNGSDAILDCLSWLKMQPSKSVVFLCFGSLGLFSKEQLHEIAIGLERSGQSFLWVVRNPPPQNQSLATTALPDPDLASLLPDGFLDRTKDRGFVVKSWVPQVTVLSHDSIGGFVTHCGWNSVLEALSEGVPMVAWPIYAEQRYNRVLLVEEMKIALPMNELENGFVSAAEVEKRVRELMDSVEGNLVRERTMAMKNAAMYALSEGGSSRIALAKFVESWK
ncbi:UDPGT domain-containing protein [Cephalotus follicularis]|uniref:Glycosyltransferase n=1 Tax=Cephalotus follicularis TaxID=3775 RepID=A0A1Q3C7S8_CEPFO|nr:UDPGT domain-containing protein [Cephalotus follicularis]